MKKIACSLFTIACLLFIADIAMSATYYIRPDGGAAEQCNRSSDTPYPGSGIGLSCACVHPFWALDSSGNWRIQGGDTLLIHSGSYLIGFGAIGDLTDIGHWWLWFRGLSSSTYLNSLYNEGRQHANYSRLPTAPAGENEIIRVLP